MNVTEITAYLEGTSTTIASLGIPDVSAGAAIAAGLISVIQAAINKHNSITGQPLDLTLLQNIDPVE